MRCKYILSIEFPSDTIQRFGNINAQNIVANIQHSMPTFAVRSSSSLIRVQKSPCINTYMIYSNWKKKYFVGRITVAPLTMKWVTILRRYSETYCCNLGNRKIMRAVLFLWLIEYIGIAHPKRVCRSICTRFVYFDIN